MKVRQDAWTEEDDLLLAETVLRHVREGSTQLNAFEEVGDKLDRTSAACGFRWNAVVRHKYEKALQLAKKQRKQRQRMLGREQSGKKKLLYTPPVPTMEELELAEISLEMMPTQEMIQQEPVTLQQEDTVPTEAASPATATYMQAQMMPPAQLNLDHVISYLQTLKHSSIQLDIYRNENERLKRELATVRRRNDELEEKVGKLEQNTETIQEDYETLMKIMNRARKLVLFDEEEKPATKFKMDKNGNLEKVAE